MGQQRRGSVLLQLRWAVDPSRDRDFNRWYDEEHLDDMCRVPGILGGRRFERVVVPYSSPTEYNYLTTYQVRDLGVFESDAYRVLGTSPSEWTKRAAYGLPMAREVAQEAYSSVEGSHQPTGDAIVHVFTDCDERQRDAYLAWYDEEHIPMLSTAPGVLGGRRYRLVQASEPGWYSVAIYEVADEAVPASDGWMAAGRPTPRRQALGDHVRSHLQVYRQLRAVELED